MKGQTFYPRTLDGENPDPPGLVVSGVPESRSVQGLISCTVALTTGPTTITIVTLDYKRKEVTVEVLLSCVNEFFIVDLEPDLTLCIVHTI